MIRRPLLPLLILVTLTGIVAACADERPPVAADLAARQEPGPVTRSAALDASAPLDGAAAANDAGSDASEGDGAPPGDAAPDSSPISYDPDAICPPTITLGAGTLLPRSTAGNDAGLTVTPDGLSAAWTTRSGAAVTIHYVDRATTGEPFGEERSVTRPFGGARVALEEDGLGLAAVNADGLGFTYFVRGSRGEAFGDPSSGPFELLAAQGNDDLAPLGERFANPVFANHDRYLVYTRVAAGSSRTFVSTRFTKGAPFAGGAPFAESALGGAGGQRRVVTGSSADVRTLFVWDEVAEKSRVVTLNASSLVTSDVELGTMGDVQPSADCRTFWFAVSGDLFTYERP